LPNGAGNFRPGERLQATQEIIRVLKTHGISKAIAFVNTIGVEEEPEKVECLRAWVAAGYELGNHTHAHTGLSNQSAEDFISELKQTEAALARLNLPLMKSIRYPFLQEGATLSARMSVRKWLRENGYILAPPTVDSWDWDTNGKWQSARSDKGRQRALDNGLKIAINNFHQSLATSRDLFGRDVRHTLLLHLTVIGPQLLPLILEKFTTEGVKFESLEKVLRDPIYKLDPGIAVSDMGNLLEMLRASRDDARIPNGERLHGLDYHARKIDAARSAAFICQELFTN
jgi:peptidoglycan/xylan/chitin deacetylase (PgdA/CDA1 family)